MVNPTYLNTSKNLQIILPPQRQHTRSSSISITVMPSKPHTFQLLPRKLKSNLSIYFETHIKIRHIDLTQKHTSKQSNNNNKNLLFPFPKWGNNSKYSLASGALATIIWYQKGLSVPNPLAYPPNRCHSITCPVAQWNSFQIPKMTHLYQISFSLGLCGAGTLREEPIYHSDFPSSYICGPRLVNEKSLSKETPFSSRFIFPASNPRPLNVHQQIPSYFLPGRVSF